MDMRFRYGGRAFGKTHMQKNVLHMGVDSILRRRGGCARARAPIFEAFGSQIPVGRDAYSRVSKIKLPDPARAGLKFDVPGKWDIADIRCR